MIRYERYEHHGVGVWVRADLKGTHREHCLCHACTKLDITNHEKNCPIASELYALCVKHGLTTPVFECGQFVPKDPKAVYGLPV